MEQMITLRLKLYRPTNTKRALYAELSDRTTAFANNLVAAGRPRGLTSRTAAPHLPGKIPSAVINQALRDVAAHKHVKGFRVLPPAFNNQNLKLAKAGDFWTAAFPTHRGQVRVPLAVTQRQATFLEGLGMGVQQGVAKLYCKRHRWYLALSVTVLSAPCAGTKVAGIDLGLRNLTVVNCEGETLFFQGNRAAYVRRRMSGLRRRMGKAKALRAIHTMKDKEARWMKDLDHKISRQVVKWCLARGVGTIRMEDLTGIRMRRTWNRRDRGRSLHSWSFHRLQQFIAYKARLNGITIQWVLPANTSRACPDCGVIDKASRNGIRFTCTACGYEEHADSVGARNIAKAISGLAAA